MFFYDRVNWDITPINCMEGLQCSARYRSDGKDVIFQLVNV